MRNPCREILVLFFFCGWSIKKHLKKPLCGTCVALATVRSDAQRKVAQPLSINLQCTCFRRGAPNQHDAAKHGCGCLRSAVTSRHSCFSSLTYFGPAPVVTAKEAVRFVSPENENKAPAPSRETIDKTKQETSHCWGHPSGRQTLLPPSLSISSTHFFVSYFRPCQRGQGCTHTDVPNPCVKLARIGLRDSAFVLKKSS